MARDTNLGMLFKKENMASLVRCLKSSLASCNPAAYNNDVVVCRENIPPVWT